MGSGLTIIYYNPTKSLIHHFLKWAVDISPDEKYPIGLRASSITEPAKCCEHILRRLICDQNFLPQLQGWQWSDNCFINRFFAQIQAKILRNFDHTCGAVVEHWKTWLLRHLTGLFKRLQKFPNRFSSLLPDAGAHKAGIITKGGNSHFGLEWSVLLHANWHLNYGS